jgi:hypothetical protein
MMHDPIVSQTSVAQVDAGAPTKVLVCLKAVSAHYNISRTELLSSRRAREVVRPRQVIYWLARRHTTASLPEIGRRLGGRDHTTVLHGIRLIEALRESDVLLRRDVDLIDATITAARQNSTVRLVKDELPDPLRTAISIITMGNRVNVSTAELASLGHYIFEQAWRAGDIIIDGDEFPDPDPEAMPAVVVEQHTPADLQTAVRDAITAYAAWESASTTIGERGARDALAGRMAALKAAFEGASK